MARLAKSQSFKKLQQDLGDLKDAINRSERGSASYLEYVTSEHKMICKLKDLHMELECAENEEKIGLQNLSSALREGHEIERIRAERTRFVSIFFSLIGTALGAYFGYKTKNYNLGLSKTYSDHLSSKINSQLTEFSDNILNLIEVKHPIIDQKDSSINLIPVKHSET
ncbi:MAG: Coiled-coil domain-containing protein 51, partial [Paramarteilia canceri]